MQNHYCFDRLDRHGLINRLALTNFPKIHCLTPGLCKKHCFLFKSWDDCNRTPKNSGNSGSWEDMEVTSASNYNSPEM